MFCLFLSFVVINFVVICFVFFIRFVVMRFYCYTFCHWIKFVHGRRYRGTLHCLVQKKLYRQSEQIIFKGKATCRHYRMSPRKKRLWKAAKSEIFAKILICKKATTMLMKIVLFATFKFTQKFGIFANVYEFSEHCSAAVMSRPCSLSVLSKIPVMLPYPGWNVSAFLSQLPCPKVLPQLSCHGCIGTVVPSRLPCPSCPVLAVMFWPALSSLSCAAVLSLKSFLAILSRLSSPGPHSRPSCPLCPVPTVLSLKSCPSCPAPELLAPALLYPLSCPSCHVWLSCRLSCPGWLSRLHCQAGLSRLTYPGYPVRVVMF
jgi:hypothetical protein